jgi:2-dehydropantoate 2-reductase
VAIWVVGAGAIGCMVGARLAVTEDVVFIDGWEEQVNAINAGGLRVDYPDGTVVARSRAFLLADVGSVPEPPDVVLLSVKSNQTEATIRRLAGLLPMDACVVSVQNGMNEETIAAAVGAGRTIGAMITGDSSLAAPGHAVTRMAKRRLMIGELDGSSTSRIRGLASRLSASLPTQWTDNITGQLWSKLVRNSMLNALGAVTGLETDVIARQPAARAVALGLGRECVLVAAALGIALDPALLEGPVAGYLAAQGSALATELDQMFEARYGSLPGVRSSMLQDVMKGRATEVDYLNGYIVRKGAETMVATPLNEAVSELVHDIEIGRRTPGPQSLLEPWAAALTARRASG